MIEITLNWHEVSFAAQAGIRRRISALINDRAEPYGWDEDRDPWASDIESCGAEMAVAKHLGRYWTPVADKPGELPGDVGTVQVRSTDKMHGGLFLYERDPNESITILARGHLPTFEMTGWIPTVAGKDPIFWQTHLTRKPCFYVKAGDLRTIESLAL